MELISCRRRQAVNSPPNKEENLDRYRGGKKSPREDCFEKNPLEFLEILHTHTHTQNNSEQRRGLTAGLIELNM